MATNLPELPWPVAHLLRRARNAKSPKDRHDTAYYAWEASVRLAAAAEPPPDGGLPDAPSVGAWVGAAALDRDPRHAKALLQAYALFWEVRSDGRPAPGSVTARELVDASAPARC
jgi:hypothetical protein